MFKYFSCILLLFISTCQVSQEQVRYNKVKIAGQIEHPQEHGFVYLYLLNNSSRKQVAKIKPNAEGFFETEVQTKQPTFFEISFYGIQNNILVVHEKDLKIRAHGNNTFGYFKIDQSVENERLAAWLGLVKYFRDKLARDSAKPDYDRLAFLAQRHGAFTTFIDTLCQNHSIVSYYAIMSLNTVQYLTTYEAVAEMLRTHYPDFINLEYLETKIQKAKNTAIGQKAPKIEIQDIDGKEVSLAALQGQYVLLEFWASWCKPCRVANPDLVALYEKFKDQDFEILGISLDHDEAAWKKAIADDKLGWLHVSELKGWESAINQTYFIAAIPSNVLIDEKGLIIAKNLNADEVAVYLAKR